MKNNYTLGEMISRSLGTYTKKHKEIADKLGIADPIAVKFLMNSVYGNCSGSINLNGGNYAWC